MSTTYKHFYFALAQADKIFQVKPTATEAELKKAYKVNALKYHPGT